MAVGGKLNVHGTEDVIGKQRTIVGSCTAPKVGMMDRARFVADPGVEIDRLFTDRRDLDEADQACRDVDKQAGGKRVFVFETRRLGAG